MSRRELKPSLATLLAASLLLGIVPACSAQGLRSPSPQTAESDGSGNIVYRPVYPPRRAAKPLYIGGYAGTVYPPLGTRPPYNPTGYATQPVAPPKWCWWRR